MHDGHILYRIECVNAFSNVKKGNTGGFVESEENLSQDGLCWIYDEAKVLAGAKVYYDACVCDNAEIKGIALVYDDALKR